MSRPTTIDGNTQSGAPEKSSIALTGRSRWRGALIDVGYLAAPLLLLGLIGLRVATTGLLQYPDPALSGGDYYRYVNEALPNGDYFYSHISPFLDRILVPLIVHGLILIGVPFRIGFFSLASLSLVISTILIFYLVRGAGLSRFEAMCASFAFVTLQWAVAFNIYEYFLVDPEAQAFVAGMLLAIQREKYALVAVIGTVGIICKENILVGVVFAAVQMLIPYFRPISGAVNEFFQYHFVALIRRVPRNVWGRLAPIVAGPLITSFIIGRVQHPIGTNSLIGTWRHYIPTHFKWGLYGLYVQFGVSTWVAFGALFAIALGALVLKIWPRGRFSIWAVFGAFLVILYSYTIAGSTSSITGQLERLSIVGWPFVLLYASITLHELSLRLRVSAALLWGLAFVAQLAFQPVAGPNPPGAAIVGSEIGSFLTRYGGNIMAVVSWIFVALIAYAAWRGTSQPGTPAIAGTSGDFEDDSAHPLATTARRPSVRGVTQPPSPSGGN